MISDPKIATAPRMTTSRLSPKNMSLLKLLAAFPISIPEDNTSTMSQDDQVSAEKSKDLVSRMETAPKCP